MSAGAESVFAQTGEQLHAFAAELYPHCRSITGDGLRATLAAIAARIPVRIHEVASGTEVFDWVVPEEWNAREAWIEDARGRRVVDFARSNLHLVGYSAPFEGRVTRAELESHLHSLPEYPDWIPYRTSYYRRDWGFCLAQREREALLEGDYRVRVDTTLSAGSLSYGELLLPGDSEQEILLSCHVCHPSLANDNLSSIAVFTALALELGRRPRRWSYRFVFAPGTIGAIVWLARNGAVWPRIRGGLVGACLGDPGQFHYKRSRRGDAEIDRAAIHVLATSCEPYQVLDFEPFGYDERQYNSPGVAMAVGSLTRTPHGRYPEYHTSADDLSFIRPRALAESLARYREIVDVLEGNRRYRNLNPCCEPMLGRRGLYRQVGGGQEGRENELALLWVLNQSDGEHSLLDIAERSGMRFSTIRAAADSLIGAKLLTEVSA